ncbi:DNA-binding protein [Nakamurella antarctica]|uniref:DNA-binding protein n=1 Tax=Nakamurella antarctica TaxID=1902245 RepID=A0A3G8ZHW5_9ACTN|nr:helix-turn-helix domain-containing protein [Nakamurella antarctica]AZI56959.1 DNA-binding protein [Nakamurella antarctica]
MSKSKKLTLADVRKMTTAALTRTEGAEVLDVDVRTLDRAIEEGTFPAIRIGRRVLIPREQFIRILDGVASPAA